MNVRLRSTLAGLGASGLVLSGIVAASAAPASAAPSGSYACGGGDIPGGTYSSISVTGWCTVPDGANLVILRDLTIAPGAAFDAQTHSTVEIGGNVFAKPGSMFGLGCTEAHPCNDGQPGTQTDTVNGNVILDRVFDAAINGSSIGGNLVSNGGGAGLLDPEAQFVPFSVKDDVIKGNVNINGLDTVWFGIIRTQIGGNVLLNDVHLSDNDGNEIVANEIGGNLVCHDMSPSPQLGDAVEGAPPGYGPNQVGGQTVGQCAALSSSNA